MKNSLSPDTAAQKGPCFEDIAILGGLALFLSVLEFMIPKPLPFMRLGIANVPLLIALYFLRDRELFLLGLVKIFGQGLLNGTLISYIVIFSALGTLGSILTMVLLRRIAWNHCTILGISVAGALGGNLLQLLMARFWIFGDAALLIAPPFLGIGLISSVIIGIFTLRFAGSSRWLAGVMGRCSARKVSGATDVQEN